MSRNKAFTPLLSEIKRKRKEQDRHQVSWFRGRHRTVFTTKTSILTLTNVSSTGWTDLDVSAQTATGGGNIISDDAFALLLYVVFSDSASATNDTYIAFRDNGTTDTSAAVDGHHRNNTDARMQVIAHLDSDYIFEYNVGASGANTATAHVYIIGYIEQIS